MKKTLSPKTNSGRNTFQIVFLFLFLYFGHSSICASQDAISKQSFEYAVVNGEHLLLDRYQPIEKSHAKRPVMIWMHGGGFYAGARDGESTVKFMETLANEGYVSVSISYRLLRKGKKGGFGCNCSADEKRMIFREAAKDLWKAISFVYAHAEEWNIDTNQIIVGGSSAGAEAVTSAIYLKDWVFEDAEDFQMIQDIPIAGVLSLAGAIVDQRYITEQSAVPGIFFHGTNDRLVPYATAPHHYCDPNRLGYIWLDGARTITKRLDELNTPYVLATYPDAGHEISGIPFNEMDELIGWMKNLFLKKEFLQLEVERIRE